MASAAISAVECNLCKNSVSCFCQGCQVNLCYDCIKKHMESDSSIVHSITDYKHKNDAHTFCDSHSRMECTAYCKTCHVPICLQCVSIGHKSHEISELSDKIEELFQSITQENDRLQSSRNDLIQVLDHMNQQMSSLSSYYEQKKEEVSARGEKCHRQIDGHVTRLHHEFDILKNKNEAMLQKQKKDFEKNIDEIDKMNRLSTRLWNSNSRNVQKMERFKLAIERQNTIKEFTQCAFPIFHESTQDENQLQHYIGCIEILHESKMSLSGKRFEPDTVSIERILEVPLVISVTDTGFPCRTENNNRLYDMAVTDNKKVWMGGYCKKLKLFDLKGNLERTIATTWFSLYICMLNKHVLYTDKTQKTVTMISDSDTLVTMFTTGDWVPYGLTGSASGDLLVCLLKDNQSKVVRYSSTGTVIQEIQFDSQCQPLFREAWYITENVNEDIVVTDKKKAQVTAVNKLGIFRYSYQSEEDSFAPIKVVNNLVGHVFVTDFNGNKIHMLDRDGQFLRYIIPREGIERPRAMCMIGNGEMIVGECLSGLAKRIRFMEDDSSRVFHRRSRLSD
ncbi:uncharacterized protein LOC144627657 [Crassostrea virginica]